MFKFTHPVPQNTSEESTLLRFLVVLLSSIAILTIDQSIHSNFSPLAIPILILGSTWSYQRRAHGHTLLNRIAFSVSLTLTLTCLFGPFLSQLQRMAEQNHAELALFLLALTLVCLQLLRSSALHRRRDLSLAVLRSALTIGVAAAASHNLGFLFFGSIYLALLLPTMMLLYRSSLHLPPTTAQRLPWPHLAKIALATVFLGAVLTLFAPHFQLSQLGIQLPQLEQLAATIPVFDHSSSSAATPADDSLLPPLTSSASEQGQEATQNILTSTAPPLSPTNGSPAAQHHPPQPMASQAAQLQSLQQDLNAIATQAPQLTTPELHDLQSQLNGLQTQLEQQPTPGSAPIAPSPQQAEQLSEQIKAVQSTVHQLQTQPRPSAARTNSPPPSTPNSQLQKLQQQLKTTQTSITQVLSTPAPAPTKPPLTPEAEKKQQEKLTNIARFAVLFLSVIGGVIWYLHQQGTKEHKRQAKRHKFNQLPPVEQIYRLMLKELAKSNGIRRSPQTELEFSQLQQLRWSSQIHQLIAEISAEYVAWRYGDRPVNQSVLADKFHRFQTLHTQELAQKASTASIQRVKSPVTPSQQKTKEF